MVFMSSAPSLSGTIYRDQDLTRARHVWLELEKRYAPGWFANPVGRLALMFQSHNPHDAFLLIDIAYWLDLLWNHNVTQESMPVLKDKLRSLMTESNKDKFDELLTEIGVAAQLCHSVSPIAFEPFVMKRQSEGRFVQILRRITRTTGRQLSSPDYALVLPDGTVAIEVTVLYIDQLQSWQRRVDEIRDALKKKVLAADATCKSVDLRLPLKFDKKLGNKICERSVIDKIMREEQGELRVDVGSESAHLQWRPLPIYQKSQFDIRHIPSDANIFAVTNSRSQVRSAFGFTSRPVGSSEQFEELMYRSLMNTLARKRDQFRVKNHRYILILKLGHPRMPTELLHNLFRKRIWPNEKYRWLTCFGEFQLRRGYTPTDPGYNFLFQTNPSGVPLPGPFLESLLNGEKTFHTHNESIKVESRAEKTLPSVRYPSPLGGFRAKVGLLISKMRYIYKVITGRE